MATVYYKTEIITPEKAREYMKCNVRNRTLSDKKIKEYAKIMADNKWMLNPADPIVFDINGILINGQHRLAAIERYGKPIEFVVGRGADPDSFHVMDCGKKRSVGDIFSISGIKNCSIVASIINHYFSLKRGRREISIGARTRIHNTDIPKSDFLAEYYSDEIFWDETTKFSRNCYTAFPCMKVSDVGGIYAYLVKIKNHDEITVRRFFTELTQGGMEVKAIAQLRMMLVNDKSATKKFTIPYRHALIIKTWNLYYQKRYKSPLVIKDEDFESDFLTNLYGAKPRVDNPLS